MSQAYRPVSQNSHLLAAVDEALLHGRDALLLLDLLLDLRDLLFRSLAADRVRGVGGEGNLRYLVVHLDVQLNLLTRQRSYPGRTISSGVFGAVQAPWRTRAGLGGART